MSSDWNAKAANSYSEKERKKLKELGICRYCMTNLPDCRCVKGYGAWYGNPDPATHLLKQVRINGELKWVPKTQNLPRKGFWARLTNW
jgi:hypothetical protein